MGERHGVPPWRSTATWDARPSQPSPSSRPPTAPFHCLPRHHIEPRRPKCSLARPQASSALPLDALHRPRAHSHPPRLPDRAGPRPPPTGPTPPFTPTVHTHRIALSAARISPASRRPPPFPALPSAKSITSHGAFRAATCSPTPGLDALIVAYIPGLVARASTTSAPLYLSSAQFAGA